MNGFLDRLASRAMEEAPLVHPRVRSHFEPGAGELPGGMGEEVAGPVEESPENAETPETTKTAEKRAVVERPRTFEPEVSRTIQPAAERRIDPASETSFVSQEVPPIVETPHEASPAAATTIRGERWQIGREVPEVRSEVRPEVRPEIRPEGTEASAHPIRFLRRDRRSGDAPRGVSTVKETRSAAPLEHVEPPPLRPRSALAEELPTLEPGRRAPLPPSLEESDPSETVVHVSIGRIDVRASQPPTSERRPARPIAGPRLSLEDYLKRREERRR